MIIDYDNEMDLFKIIEEENVILDFWAPWCGPCKQLSPILKKISDEHNIKIIKINTDDFQEEASEFNVRALPTLVFYKNGEAVDKSIGFINATLLTDKVKGIFE